MIQEFFSAFQHYMLEVIPYLFLGFLLSGVIHEFLPGDWVKKHLGGTGIKPLLYSTLSGTLLPICCIGSLPVGVSMHKKGARLGAVLAFLVATPATSFSALIVCYALLGLKFTVFLFFAVIVMGLVIGYIGNMIKLEGEKPVPGICPYKGGLKTDPICGMMVDPCKGIHASKKGKDFFFCSRHCLVKFEQEPEKYMDKGEKGPGLKERLVSILKYAFVEMPKEMGLEILIGLALAAAVASVAPLGKFIGNHFSGTLAYAFSLPFGLVMYICSTASVPLVDAFLAQGMNVGAGMTLLMAGPVTSMGTILVLKKEFGYKVLVIYLLVICVVSLGMGLLYSAL